MLKQDFYDMRLLLFKIAEREIILIEEINYLSTSVE